MKKKSISRKEVLRRREQSRNQWEKDNPELSYAFDNFGRDITMSRAYRNLYGTRDYPLFSKICTKAVL